MTRSPATAALALVACCLAPGCGWQQRHDAYKVVDEYCDAEMRGDMPAKYQRLTPESLEVLRNIGSGGAIAGMTVGPTPMPEWGLQAYTLQPGDVNIRKEKAYAQVTGAFSGPRQQVKNITFTVYLKRYEEPKVGGGTEKVWRVNEIETKYRLGAELVGREYADLWMRQLKTQLEWKRATSPGPRGPVPR